MHIRKEQDKREFNNSCRTLEDVIKTENEGHRSRIQISHGFAYIETPEDQNGRILFINLMSMDERIRKENKS